MPERTIIVASSLAVDDFKGPAVEILHDGEKIPVKSGGKTEIPAPKGFLAVAKVLREVAVEVTPRAPGVFITEIPKEGSPKLRRPVGEGRPFRAEGIGTTLKITRS